MENSDLLWDVGSLPFIWTQFDNTEGDKEIPSTLPFKLSIDLESGVLKQVPDEQTEKFLSLAYKKGSVLAGVVDEGIASKPYVDDFIDFIFESTGKRTLAGLDILEIGCGTGYLLSVMRGLGANTLGVEPGEHALLSKEKYGVEVIRDFFPSDEIEGKFDIVVLALVLEHFVNPQKILSTIHPYLKPNGKVLISVPNEEPFLAVGDISSLFHEHYSYFTDSSLENVLVLGGFKVTKKSFGQRSGLLLAEAETSNLSKLDNVAIDKCYKVALKFRDLAESNLVKIKESFRVFSEDEKTIGIYVPSRILNFLSILDINTSKIRFFDDNQSIHNKYFPGFAIRVENRIELKSDCPEVILIFSKNFGEKIKNSLEKDVPPEVEIFTWSDLFEM